MQLTAHRFGTMSVVAVVPLLLALTGCTKYGATLARPEDPVVLDGVSTPKLLGDAVAAVVGFAWDGSIWHQIPVQVDERDFVNPGHFTSPSRGRSRDSWLALYIWIAVY